MEKTKIMFDTNSFDKMQTELDKLLLCTDKIEYYVTDIQIKELVSIPDKNITTRINNVLCLFDLRPQTVHTSFSYKNLRFSKLCFSTGSYVDEITNGNINHANDALIADAAIRENCILITNDIKLTKKMNTLNKKVMTFEDFTLKYLKT